MPIIRVEFDKSVYATTQACTQWLTTSEYKEITNFKGFKLKPGKSDNMSKEPRKVWAWQNDHWMYNKVLKHRPDPHVYIEISDGAPHFTLQDIPALTTKTLNMEQKEKAKQEKKEKSELQRKAKLSEERKKKAEEKRLRELNETPEERVQRIMKEEDEKKRKKQEREENKKRKRPSAVPKKKTEKKKKIRTESLKEKISDDDEGEEPDLSVMETRASGATKKADKAGTYSKEVLSQVEVPDSALNL